MKPDDKSDILYEQNLWRGKKKHNFLFIGDVRRSNRESQKGWRENEISEGEGGLTKWNSEGMEFEHFGISKGKGVGVVKC